MVKNEQNSVVAERCLTEHELARAVARWRHLPHVAVAGESNAGKSSLINHLLKKEMARFSSIAGKTRSVDLFNVNDRLVVTDLPGLPARDGQATELWHKEWKKQLVDAYLRTATTPDDELSSSAATGDGGKSRESPRPPLRCVLLAHDVRWEVSDDVRNFVGHLRSGEFGDLPVVLVLTKDDRILARIEKRAPDTSADDLRAWAHRQRRKLTRMRRAEIGLDGHPYRGEFPGVHLHYSTNSALPASRGARRTVLRLIESLANAHTAADANAVLEALAEPQRAYAVRRHPAVGSPGNTDVAPANVAPANTDVAPANVAPANTDVAPANTDVAPANTDVAPAKTDEPT